MFAVQAIDVRLKVIAPVFEVAHTLAGQLETMFLFLDLIGEAAQLTADLA